MLLSPPPASSLPAGPIRNRLPEILSQVARARPDLSPESDEYRAAVLLLLAGDTGLNVDRLARRAGYAREFVARCLRRLVDNGWSAGDEPARGGASEDVLHEGFWRDVDVALGRRLRRKSESGEPEWAPINGWVKEFEYGGRSADSPVIHNEYRHIPPYNPEPVAPAQGAAEEDRVPEEEEVPAREPEIARRAAPVAPRPAEATGPVHWLGGETAAEAAVETGAAEADESLVRGWADAKWLR